ncbi:chorismate lyase [Janthinobacterium sp. 17J80-10]|uniref:chorismate--pyruvate lyase family protein n=1 Tax=Janthinobacterium sp. 17J80-10 TaxID=2497863 RepID=UPI001005911A|nr:chorismate lyase [Janthinobacterium sp. 17J80-10]QAU33534.1 chorismate lyase [Janthinobacterium sp. 17J80-10]
MSGRASSHAQWFSHVNAVNPSPQMRHWLTDRISLTVKLAAHCRQFRVQRLHQRRGMVLADECQVLGLAHRIGVQERDVLLHCDEVPMVFAHTVVPLSASATDWPFYSSLGERSLGFTLFCDPQVARGALHYARLRPGHPLLQRAAAALGIAAFSQPLLARRCLFRRKRGSLLVTEVFLPMVSGLVPQQDNLRHTSQILRDMRKAGSPSTQTLVAPGEAAITSI